MEDLKIFLSALYAMACVPLLSVANDDIEPIQMCGAGVAVANAIETVISEADYVAGSNDEDGVARFIEGKVLSII